MTARLQWTTTITLLCVVIPGTAIRAEEQKTSTPVTADPVEAAPQSNTSPGRLIGQLGDPSYSNRETAQAALLDLGEAARKALEKALAHTDLEVVARAKACLAELDQRVEKRRIELRQAAGDAARRDDRTAATRHYLALINLPRPPLRDCRAATSFFGCAHDHEALAVAHEATAREMKRVIHAPVREFLRPAPEPQAPGQVHGGPTVLVQTELDGEWVTGNGDGSCWIDWLSRKQDRMKQQRIDLLVELARLYCEDLDAPDRAAEALADALYDVDFCTRPLAEVIAENWPPGGQRQATIEGATGYVCLNTLGKLAETQQKAGDLRGAIDTKARQLLAHFILCWGHRQKVFDRPAFELAKLVRNLPAGADLPPLFWINILSPDHPEVTLDPDADTPLKIYDFNVLARPGCDFASLSITIDMEVPKSPEEGNNLPFVDCYTIFEKHHSLAHFNWHDDSRPGREKITQSCEVPPNTDLIRFETQPFDAQGIHFHSISVKATFRSQTSASTDSPKCHPSPIRRFK